MRQEVWGDLGEERFNAVGSGVAETGRVGVSGLGEKGDEAEAELEGYWTAEWGQGV